MLVNLKAPLVAEDNALHRQTKGAQFSISHSESDSVGFLLDSEE